jgi:outer membrane protein insertion porin family
MNFDLFLEIMHRIGLRVRYYAILATLAIFVLQACTSVDKRLQKQYPGKSILYKQSIKGNEATSVYYLEEYLKQQPNRKFIFPWIMPYAQAYMRGEAKFEVNKTPEQLHADSASIEAKYTPLLKQARKNGDSSAVNQIKLDLAIELSQATASKYVQRNLKRRIGVDSTFARKIRKQGSKSPPDSSKIRKLQIRRIKKLSKIPLTKEEGNWLMNTVGEPPAIFDLELALKTEEQLEKYIESKGYFKKDKVRLTLDSTKKGRRIHATYNISEGKVKKIHQIIYDTSNIKDPQIIALVKKHRNEAKIKIGQNHNSSRLSAERERLYKLLKNNGYFKFQRQYIYLESDTLDPRINYNTKLKIIIKDPLESGHKIYRVEEVNVIIDGKKPGPREIIDYAGIKYNMPKGVFKIGLLDEFIQVRPSELYSYSKTEITQNSLGNTDIFKFVNINYQEKDSTNLVAYITASTFQKYQLSSEGGMTFNVGSGVSIPGPFINGRLKWRKVLSGFEIIDFSGLAGIQGQVGFTDGQLQQTTIFDFSGGLSFPKFIIPNFSILDKYEEKIKTQNPKTRLSLGYSDVSRFDYSRAIVKTAMTFQRTPNPQTRITFSLIDLNIVDTRDQSTAFKNYLDDLDSRGINLKQSFQTSFVSNFAWDYVFNNNDVTKNRKAHYYHVNAEPGGVLLPIFDKLDGTDGKIGNRPYFKFFRLNGEYRKYTPVGQNSNLAFKINTGVGTPTGRNDDLPNVLPYEKFFFVGGISSIRAWSPRRLGPGTYVERNENGEKSYQFEQPGELMLESSIEYRGKLFSFVHGALFADFGNVWLLKEDEAKPGAHITPQFWKQIAIGTGAGLRFDFSFLIFRFDLGIKVYDPADQEIVTFKFKDTTLNIGIGYPF